MSLSRFMLLSVVFLVSCKSTGAGQAESGMLGSFEELPSIQDSGKDAVLEWARRRTVEAEKNFRLRRLPSPDFWGKEIIYQVMPDRFNDGDPRNNLALIPEVQEKRQATGYVKISEYRQGGDLKGIENRLDYLQDLGITAIWVTPIFTNNDGSYHSYCTSDLTQIDPNYGSKDDLVRLVARAHDRGIKIILDVVVNHFCDRSSHYLSSHAQNTHTKCAEDLAKANQEGLPTQSSGQIDLSFSSSFFGPLKTNHFFNRCGPNSGAEMEGDGALSIYGDFTSQMFDLDTRNYDFQEIYAELLKYWIALADIDGLRLDAVKHIPPSFTTYLSVVTRDYAHSLGKENFYVVAEVAGKSSTIVEHLGQMPHAVADRTWGARLKDQVSSLDLRPVSSLYAKHPYASYPGVNGVYDFAHSGIARDVLLGKRPSGALEYYFQGDPYYKDLASANDPRLNLTLLEIHDWERFNDEYPENRAKSRLGLSYLSLAQGIPIIYYGMEQGLNAECRLSKVSQGINRQDIESFCRDARGAHRHPLNRQAMFTGGMLQLGSSIKEIDDLAYIGPARSTYSGSWRNDPYLRREHDVYQASRRANYLRRSSKALSFGLTEWLWASQHHSDVFAFMRVDPVEKNRIAIMIVNPSREKRAGPILQVHRPGFTLLNVEKGAQEFLVGPNGQLDLRGVEIAPESIVTLIPKDQVGRYSSYLKTYLVNDFEVKVPEER